VKIAVQPTHRRAVARDQARQLAGFERAHPCLDDLRMADVARQEQQVVRRQRRDEGDQRVAIRRGHARDLDRRAAAVDAARVVALVLAHVERASSHESSAGHMRFTAFGPAAMLTWPPGSVISLLSFEADPRHQRLRCRRRHDVVVLRDDVQQRHGDLAKVDEPPPIRNVPS
jgi:hypothetical protein